MHITAILGDITEDKLVIDLPRAEKLSIYGHDEDYIKTDLIADDEINFTREANKIELSFDENIGGSITIPNKLIETLKINIPGRVKLINVKTKDILIDRAMRIIIENQ
ncbi:MAG: hypothetical protein N4A47_01735 [Clostridia bacterium]|jgi:hypothetical protein|nr:hypothetical protein [Clostridia bacterium]